MQWKFLIFFSLISPDTIECVDQYHEDMDFYQNHCHWKDGELAIFLQAFDDANLF